MLSFLCALLRSQFKNKIKRRLARGAFSHETPKRGVSVRPDRKCHCETLLSAKRCRFLTIYGEGICATVYEGSEVRVWQKFTTVTTVLPVIIMLVS